MKPKPKPTWNHVKAKFIDFDRAGLLRLIQDLYAASRENQAFLHARLALGEDPLKPYKTTISRWVRPDVLKNQDISVSTAKKAISNYRKAIGDPDGVAELTVFYCEETVAHLDFCGMDDVGYYDALVRMFEQALKAVAELPPDRRHLFLERLDRVQHSSQNFGYGVSDEYELAAEQNMPMTMNTIFCRELHHETRKNSFIGRWKIIEMRTWNQDYVNMEVPGHFTFKQRDSGHFQFGPARSEMDCRVTNVAVQLRLEFSWSLLGKNLRLRRCEYSHARPHVRKAAQGIYRYGLFVYSNRTG